MTGQITSEMGSLALAGLVIVFAVLSLIALVVSFFKRLDDHWQEQEKKAADRSLTRTPTIDDTTLVLLTAAVATVVSGRFKVHRIHRLLSPRTKRTPWSAQGRVTLQGSHTVQRPSRKW